MSEMFVKYIFAVLLTSAEVFSQATECDGGDCIPYHRCLSAKKLKKIPYCANGLVCCRRPSIPHYKSQSESACFDYSNDKTFCPSELLIFNGNWTSRNEQQYMAVIGKRVKGNTKDAPEWICGGTVIHIKFVLTAAHCIRLRNEDPDFFVSLGARNKNDGRVYKIIRDINHPDYNVTTENNDIALLELNETIVFNEKIKPACLATSDVADHETLTVSGWGYLKDSSKKLPDELQKAEVRVLDISGCSKANKKMHICAGGVNNISDACHGDSGGPLAKWHPKWGSCLGQVFGIVSSGGVCGSEHPRTKYTNVFNYVEWIESIVWKEN